MYPAINTHKSGLSTTIDVYNNIASSHTTYVFRKGCCGQTEPVCMFSYIGVYKIMAYGSTAYVGMTPKKNGGHIKNAQMTRMKRLR